MTNKIKILRGDSQNMPSNREDGELIYQKDTNKLYIKNGETTVVVNDNYISTAQQTALNLKANTSSLGSMASRNFWSGTIAQYNALGTWSDTTDYNIIG